MEKNENESVKTLRACENILKDLFKKYEGRLFNSGGDSFFAEFPSAVSAVECASEFQGRLREFYSQNNLPIKLQFRVGIHMGDVIKEKRNLLGDGVNIAARLEALAQPSGVTISKSIFDLVKGKVNLSFNDLGLQKVKVRYCSLCIRSSRYWNYFLSPIRYKPSKQNSNDANG